MQNKNKEVKIQKLSDRDSAREKLPIFYGSRDNYTHGANEIIMNAIDIIKRYCDKGDINVLLHEDMQTLTVTDNGTGIPIMGETDGEKNYYLLLEKLFASTNYNNLEEEIDSCGTNGLGATILNASSEYFSIVSKRDGIKATIKYAFGYLQSYEEELCDKSEHGTVVTFKLDKDMYTYVTYTFEYFDDLLNKLSSCANTITFTLKNNETEKLYHYDTKYEYFEENVNEKLSPLIEFKSKTYQTKVKKEDKELKQVDNIMAIIGLSTQPIHETFLNNTFLKNGGTILMGVVEGIKKSLSKKVGKGVKLSNDDILMSFNIYATLNTNNPEYENQTKFSTQNKLYKDNFVKYVVENMLILEQENPSLYKQMIEHVTQISKFNQKAETSRKAISKELKEKATNCTSRPAKLVPCRSKNPKEISIAFLEGDSALNSVKLGRNAYDTMVYPLKGKPINVMKTTLDKALANQEIRDMYKIFGCGMEYNGKTIKGIEPFNIDNLQIAEILIVSDCDEDGFHLQTILIGDIYMFSPELIKQGIVKVLLTPLYIIKTKTEEIYAYSEQERREIISKLTVPYKEKRFKGIGGLDVQTMHKCLDKETRKVVTLTMEDGEKSVEKLKLFLEEEVEPRRQFILEHANEYSAEEIYI